MVIIQPEKLWLPEDLFLKEIYKPVHINGIIINSREVGEVMVKKETIKIAGMSCAACAARIEKRLNKLEGVQKAAVNFVTEKASVEYDSSKVRVSDMIKAVEALGYSAKRAEEAGRDREKEREKEIQRLRIEFIISAVLSSPLVMAMILTLVNIDLAFLHNEYFQLIIATPIQFIIGFRFYKNAFYALRAKSANMDVLIAMGTSAAFFQHL